MTIDNLQKLRAPAIALIFAGSLSAMIGLVSLLGGLLRLVGIGGDEMLPADEAERIGYIGGTFITYGVSLLSILLAPVIIYGAVLMMQGKNYSLAHVTAILAIIPCTSCCFLGIPIGIWALVVLRRPEVKAAFNRDASDGDIYPPQPPQNW